jgi:hypothetical protein
MKKWLNVTLSILLVLSVLSSGFGGYTLAQSLTESQTESQTESLSTAENFDPEQAYAEYETVCNQLNAAAQSYTEPDGTVKYENLSKALNVVASEVENLKNQGEVEEYWRNESNVEMRLSSGIMVLYIPKIPNVLAGGSSVSVVTFNPVYSELLNEQSTDFSQYGRFLADKKPDEFNFKNAYEDSKVTRKMIKSEFAAGKYILWEGHGGDSQFGCYLKIGEKVKENGGQYLDADVYNYYFFGLYNEILTDDQRSPTIAIGTDGTIGLYPRWFEKNIADLSGAFLYFNSCYSGKNNILANVFLGKGASAVIGYTDSLDSNYADKMAATLFTEAIWQKESGSNNYFTLSESIEYATDKNGADDGDDTPAAPRIFGDLNLRLISANLVNPNSTMPYPDKFDSVMTLVCDASGSMGERINTGETKLSALKQAGTVITDMMKKFSNQYSGSYGMGVVQFASGAKALALPHIDYPFIDACIQSMGDGGGTNISSGLELGIEQLDNVTANSKVIILMTDGKDSNHSGILRQAEDAKSKNIRVFTVGFGADADEDILKQVADATGGEYRFADTNNLVGIAAGFIYAQKAADSKVLGDQQGVVSQGETTEAIAFSVPDKTGDLNGLLYWPGSILDLIIIDPNGRTVDDTYPGVIIDDSSIPATVSVTDPLPGKWKLMVRGVETSYDEEPYYAITSFKSMDYSKADKLAPIERIGAFCLPIGVFLALLCMMLLVFINAKSGEVEIESDLL